MADHGMARPLLCVFAGCCQRVVRACLGLILTKCNGQITLLQSALEHLVPTHKQQQNHHRHQHRKRNFLILPKAVDPGNSSCSFCRPSAVLLLLLLARHRHDGRTDGQTNSQRWSSFDYFCHCCWEICKIKISSHKLPKLFLSFSPSAVRSFTWSDQRRFLSSDLTVQLVGWLTLASHTVKQQWWWWRWMRPLFHGESKDDLDQECSVILSSL